MDRDKQELNLKFMICNQNVEPSTKHIPNYILIKVKLKYQKYSALLLN